MSLVASNALEMELRGRLNALGLKVTDGRLSILKCLCRKQSPITVAELLEKLSGGVDEVTLYRSLSQFVKVGMVREVFIDSKIAHFEYVHGKPELDHHHHVVCSRCKKIEDVHIAHGNVLEAALRSSKSFASITSHHLEFFGICKSCDPS